MRMPEKLIAPPMPTPRPQSGDPVVLISLAALVHRKPQRHMRDDPRPSPSAAGVLLPRFFTGVPVKAHAVVTVPGSMAAYARGLYGFLRDLDQRGCDLIVASLPVEEGLGLAIANRLRRAAGPQTSA